MRIATKLYSARELATIAHFSLTQLEYLNEIRLLEPDPSATGGQRRYDDINLLRLQQIRMGRARGLSLEEIRRWLGAGPGAASAPHPLPTRSVLREAIYLETEAKVETPTDQQAFLDEAAALYASLAACHRAGARPPDPTLSRWAERHCCYINRWFCPCDSRQHLAFGRAMVRHPLHAASIERHGKELPGFLLTVLEAQREKAQRESWLG